jgi:hypothetical protein
MSFLTPAFFIGLLAVGIPILIHLTQKEKKTIIDFPSLMFLRKIPYTSVRRRSIRDIWLLLLRVAALLLMVLAFSRPWFSSASIASKLPGSTREVVILLDRSASMGYGDRWTKAQAEARKVADGLGGQDRATLVLFGSSAEENVRATSDRVRLGQAIDLAKVGAQATRFGPALRLAQSILAQSALPRKEIVLITDFQKIGWEKQEDIHLPEGTTITPVSVGGGDTADAAVTSVTFARNQFSGQDRVVATAGVVNRGAKPIVDLPMSLEIDGHAVDAKKVSIAANGTSSVTFAEFTVADQNVRGKITAGVAGGTTTTATSAGDLWPADNVFFFVLSPGRPVSVLVVQPDQADRDASLYLSTALGIGDAPKFDVETISSSKLSGAQVDKRAVVMLNDVAVLPTGGADLLKRFVERGGGLFVAAAEHAKWSETEQAALMPGVLGDTVDRPSGRVGALGYLDYSHPIFEVFRTPRAGSFSGVHFFRYRALDPKTYRVLARFDDGAAAMVERRLGGGRVIAWSTSLDSSWNDLAVKPAFLPFVRQIGGFLAAFQNADAWQTAGRALDLTSRVQAASAISADTAAAARTAGQSAPGQPAATKIDGVVSTPSGERVSLTDNGRPAFVELGEQGFYTVRLSGDRDTATPLTVAVNIDPAETELAAIDPVEFVAKVTGRADAATAAKDATPAGATPADVEKRQGVWWYLLVLGAAVLVLEAWLANRLSKGPGMIQPGQVQS